MRIQTSLHFYGGEMIEILFAGQEDRMLIDVFVLHLQQLVFWNTTNKTLQHLRIRPTIFKFIPQKLMGQIRS